MLPVNGMEERNKKMGIMTWTKNLAGKAAAYTSKHARAIITILEITSNVSAVVYGVSVTPGVVHRIDRENDERQKSRIPPMDTGEVIKLCWPYYVPCFVLMLTGAGFAIWELKLGDRKLAAIGALYSATEKTLEEYRAKTLEIVGDKKERKIRDEIAIDKVKAHPSSGQQIFITGNGDYLCYDAWFGTYFRSNIDAVRAAFLDAREALSEDPFGFMSVNEVRDYMKLPAVDGGYDIGFNEGDRLSFVPTSMLSDKGEPCLAITYSPEPHPDRR